MFDLHAKVDIGRLLFGQLFNVITECKEHLYDMKEGEYGNILIGLSRQNRSPPKIGPAGLILAGKPAKIGPPGPLLLPKLIRPDLFWLPKMVPSCQNQSPMGDRFGGTDFGKKLSAKIGPPQSGTLIPARTWLLGCSYYI